MYYWSQLLFSYLHVKRGGKDGQLRPVIKQGTLISHHLQHQDILEKISSMDMFFDHLFCIGGG
jgi:hypothetical protein